jgi:nucleoside-diphosphate-sugar epimerase
VVLDLQANFAAIPGSGNTPVALTHTKDVAAATVKLLELPQWKSDSFIIGDKHSWNEIVEIVEKAKGTWFLDYYFLKIF